jgi:hypothetical protein
MLGLFLPRVVDSAYPGHRIGLWLFGALVLARIAMSLNCIFNGYSVATSADGIPLSAFTADAARTVVSLFGIWGLAHLVLASFCAAVLVRYRSLVPLMFGLLLLEQLGRRGLLHSQPIARSGTPPGVRINLGLLAITIVGLGLSMRRWDTFRAGD